jgi:hypothetical protein
MSNIKFNPKSREIEITGSESFIDTHFHQIRALVIESFKEGKGKTSQRTGVNINPLSSGEIKEPVSEATRTGISADVPEDIPAAKPRDHETPSVPKVARPPVRKYFNTLGKLIRSEDTSINRSQPADVPRIPEELSVASLREKFGLSERQVEEVMKDAEKQGRVRKDPDGSYVWA